MARKTTNVTNTVQIVSIWVASHLVVAMMTNQILLWSSWHLTKNKRQEKGKKKIENNAILSDLVLTFHDIVLSNFIKNSSWHLSKQVFCSLWTGFELRDLHVRMRTSTSGNVSQLHNQTSWKQKLKINDMLVSYKKGMIF